MITEYWVRVRGGGGGWILTTPCLIVQTQWNNYHINITKLEPKILSMEACTHFNIHSLLIVASWLGSEAGTGMRLAYDLQYK